MGCHSTPVVLVEKPRRGGCDEVGTLPGGCLEPIDVDFRRREGEWLARLSRDSSRHRRPRRWGCLAPLVETFAEHSSVEPAFCCTASGSLRDTISVHVLAVVAGSQETVKRCRDQVPGAAQGRETGQIPAVQHFFTRQQVPLSGTVLGPEQSAPLAVVNGAGVEERVLRSRPAAVCMVVMVRFT